MKQNLKYILIIISWISIFIGSIFIIKPIAPTDGVSERGIASHPTYILVSTNTYPSGFITTLHQNMETLTPFVRTITAYNLTEEQCDKDFCIGAYGDNLCELSKTIQICATNEFPKNTILKIGDITCIVLDKTNARYKNRIDLVMDSYEKAINWGKQIKEVLIIN